MFDFPAKPGDERMMKRFAELSGPLTPDALQRDTAAYIDLLAGNECVGAGRGYGSGGLLLHRQNGSLRREGSSRKNRCRRFFHGGRLVTDGPDSPHLLLPDIKARLYFGHATHDQSMPPEAIDKLNRALEAWGGRYKSDIYRCPSRLDHARQCRISHGNEAERAFEKLKELFSQTLK